jgi:fucose permease
MPLYIRAQISIGNFTMNLFWLYDLPNTVFAAIVIGFFVSIALIGQQLTRKWVKRIPNNDGRYN